MIDHIVFPDTSSWEVAKGRVSFPAEVDGRRIKCVLPTDTIKIIAGFSSPLTDPVALFDMVKAKARSIARRLLLKGRGIATGQLLIMPQDCVER